MADVGLSESKSMILAHIVNSNVEYIKYTSDIRSQFRIHNNNPPKKNSKEAWGGGSIGSPFEV